MTVPFALALESRHRHSWHTFFKELLGISYLDPLQWIFIIGLVAVSGTVYSAYSLMFSKRISEKGYFNDTNL